jgi:23S rRNA (cytidine1920-2'-O)/16S rRNA (cytidine1409-2'-O)-methyltransferase
MSDKRRLDTLLVERGLAESRARAQALVIAGTVWSEGRRLDKPGTTLPADTPLELRGRDHPWVSRGGVKLAHALDELGLDVAGTTCLDVGASTGGFTEVVLARGARRVFAVDVGRGQLHARLRARPEVVSLEATDIRTLDPARIEPAGLVVVDVSFISLRLVLPAALTLAAPHAALVALIKPQFEAPRRHRKRGVVRDAATHAAVCADIAAFVASLGWRVTATLPSPIEGGDGNREFFIGAQRG